MSGGGEEPFVPPAFDDAAFPAVVRWGRWGIVLSGLGLAVGGATTKLAGAFVPGLRGGGVPGWMWPVLVAVWTPGVAGLLSAAYSVARYPYFSLATTGGPRDIPTGRGIWVPLGGFIMLLAPPMGLVAAANWREPATAAGMAYLAVEFAFVGWLLARYRPDRHVTVATWLALTFGLAIPLAPFYLPSILLGSRRLRRATRGGRANEPV